MYDEYERGESADSMPIGRISLDHEPMTCNRNVRQMSFGQGCHERDEPRKLGLWQTTWMGDVDHTVW